MFPSTTTRVQVNTADDINERIQAEISERVRRCSAEGAEAITRRLDELDAEWDIERALEANAASVALGGCMLGFTVSRKFFLLPIAVAGFLLQHALQGWCPPLPLLRRMGFRTAGEIAQERFALKAIRNDFGNLPSDLAQSAQQHRSAVDAVLEAVKH